MSRGTRKGARNDSEAEYPDMEGWEEADDEDDEDFSEDSDGDEDYSVKKGGKKTSE